MAVENICNFFKYGYCKFKMSCKNKHVTLVCNDENCNPSKCDKRHPRLCKYVSKYGRCKLGSICAYSHENHHRKNENQRLEKKLDELIVMVTKKDDMIVMCENKIEDLMQKNREKDAIIEKLVRDVKDLETMVKNEIISKEGNSSSKKKENIRKEIPSKAEDVTPVCDDKKKSLRSAKKKEKLQENCEEVEDKQVRDILKNSEVKNWDFTTACLNFVKETEDDMEKHTDDIETIRQKYKICTDKIENEAVAQNVVVDFGLKLLMTNMKMVNDNTTKDMISLRLKCLRRGLLDLKLKSLENDRLHKKSQN